LKANFETGIFTLQVQLKPRGFQALWVNWIQFVQPHLCAIASAISAATV
jgi:hypothetical protein